MSFAQGTPSVNTLINSSNCIVLGNTSSGTALSVQQLGAGNVASFSNAAGNLGLFVSSLGRVGVGGLTAPATPLHVSGQDAILAGTGTGSYSSNVLQLYTGATGTGYYQYSANLQGFNDTVGSVTWKFNTVNNGTSYPNNLVMKNGNVGIGTANPGYVLQVNSAATGSETVAAFLKPSMATGGTFAGIQVGGANATGGAGAMGFLNYGTNASNVFQLSLNGSGGSAININSTGVGIGVTNPATTLVVNGTITTPGFIDVTTADPGDLISRRYASADRYGIGQYTNGTTRVFMSGTYAGSVRISRAADDLRTGAATFTDLMTVLSTGNVGIGTTSPSSALHVVGQTIGTFPVHLSLYGTPSYYNTSGTLLNPPATLSYVYLLWPSYGLTSQNWTPSYTTATKLGIPYTGLYAVKFALQSGAGTNPVLETFISKNLCNGTDLNPNDDRLLALGMMPVGVIELTLSATAYLSTTDFLNFGFYLSSGTLTGSVAGLRCTVNVTLLQRTA